MIETEVQTMENTTLRVVFKKTKKGLELEKRNEKRNEKWFCFT